jgi:hypothetical protein
MTNNDLKAAIELMINEEIVKVKEVIQNDLFSKLGKALEEKLMEYAPSVFNEEKEEDDEEDEKDDSEDSEDEGDEESDDEDEESDDEDEESEDEDEESEDEDDKEEMNEDVENQLHEALSELIYEIETEQGRELTNEEIQYVAAEFINEYAILNEKLDAVGSEDGDIDNDGDEDKTDSYLHKRRKAIGKAMKKKKG